MHNGHLSSDMANARALEQLDIQLTAGTDSEAIFLSVQYLLKQGYSLEEIEWIMCRKFPQELNSMTKEARERYDELMVSPFLYRMKMSGLQRLSLSWKILWSASRTEITSDRFPWG